MVIYIFPFVLSLQRWNELPIAIAYERPDLSKDCDIQSLMSAYWAINMYVSLISVINDLPVG